MRKKIKIQEFLLLVALLISSFIVFSGTNYGSATTSKDNKSQSLPVIDFSTGVQTTNTLSNMIADFNANYSSTYGFTVNLDSSTFQNKDQHDTYVADFQAQSTSLDVISMDVIWPAEFASAGFILPLNDVFNSSYQSQFLSAPIQASTYQGNIYGVPWFHDSGMLYYRTDVLSYAYNHSIIPANSAPQNWAELNTWTVDMMSNAALVNYFNLTAGFVWQGLSYEGLMCDFMEYLGGSGTYSWLNANGTAGTFTTSYGIKAALQEMKTLITSGASPSQVLTFDEEGSRAVWNAGSAIFMRNWPYAYALSLQSSALNGTADGLGKQQFAVTTMPVENSTVSNPEPSCLGGWELGVSAYSKYPVQAKKFIMWLTSAKEQLQYFLGNGQLPTIKALYNNPTIVNSPQGYVHNFLPVFESAVPRPVSPIYTLMSAKITPLINSYLGSSTMSINTALSQMQSSVQTVINNNPIKVLTMTTTITATSSTTPTTTPSSIPSVPTTSGFELLSILAVLTITSCLVVNRKKKTLK